ncbi:tyrosine-protein phosphatase siw14, partial [Dimargaris verticillata]
MNEDDPQPHHVEFVKKHGIKFYHYRITANKASLAARCLQAVPSEPFIKTNPKDISDILSIMTDTRNYPILAHCNKGRKRIGCLVGCLRKLQNWSMAAIFDEYQRFSGTKVRIADQQ